MKKIGILIFAVAFVSMSFVSLTVEVENTLKIDVTNSSIKWKGYKPTGSHNGTIALLNGELKMKGNKLEGGFFTVDMSSLKDADNRKKLEKHLKSKDFFEVEVFPIATFEITGSENSGGKTYISGKMTIKDVTKEMTIPAIITENNGAITLTTETFKINRAEFNIKYKSKSFFNNLKEKFINDQFDLQVTIVANK
ncbi:MAG: YceI family protein [Lutibacter sp.]|nr:YceI family protein [Lutibacter sp.]